MIRINLDVQLASEANEEEIAKKLADPKVIKALAAYLESVVVPGHTPSGTKIVTAGGWAHAHEYGDQGCLKLYETKTGRSLVPFEE